MCGLFGAIGKNIDAGKIRALALINRERGTHGIGFFDNSGKSVKAGADALKALQNAEFAAFIRHKDRWFLAGHTRHATQGSISDRNAHPFRYGAFIGSHNGIVNAPKSYTVDSEYLIDSLNKAGGDYQKALAGISGWWGLTWYDGDAFYIQADGNNISIVSDGAGTYYYSSDDEHLIAATGLSHKIVTLTRGDTIRFRAGCEGYEILPGLVRDSWPIAYTVERGQVEDTGKKAGKGKKEKVKQARWTEWDDLAWDLGYSDLADVKERESLPTLEAAKDFLENGLELEWEEWEAQKEREFNADYPAF
jgi:hypothetical protein